MEDSQYFLLNDSCFWQKLLILHLSNLLTGVPKVKTNSISEKAIIGFTGLKYGKIPNSSLERRLTEHLC